MHFKAIFCSILRDLSFGELIFKSFRVKVNIWNSDKYFFYTFETLGVNSVWFLFFFSLWREQLFCVCCVCCSLLCLNEKRKLEFVDTVNKEEMSRCRSCGCICVGSNPCSVVVPGISSMVVCLL